MSLYDHPINTLDGSPLDLHDLAGKAVLVHTGWLAHHSVRSAKISAYFAATAAG